MTLAVRAVFWVLAYLGVVVAPLVLAAIGGSDPGHGFWTDFAVAMGFVGLAFVLVHVAISARWESLTLHNAIRSPALVWLGMAAALALIALVATSVWRRGLRLPYEWWHAIHTVLAVVAVVGALAHVYFVDEYVDTPWKQLLWGLMTAAFLSLLVWVRLVQPRRMRARPWRLERVEPERGRTTTLALRPPAGDAFRFQPGQFAWFGLGRSPFALTMHPFSFSSSAERDEVEIAVKALGDFTARVHELAPGTAVYVDGPHGVFSIDRDEGPGFGLVAGGVGITGLLSMLRTMADRADPRPAILVYANGDWDGVAFREELERLERRIDLTVVHVLERPPAGWSGETGFVTAELLSRHLPTGHRRFQFFICGPGPMMDAAEAALAELGVPGERIHTERFDMV